MLCRSAGVQADLAEQAFDAGDDGLARIVGRGQQLAGVDEVAPRIVQHEIGEGAADIDAERALSRAMTVDRHRHFDSVIFARGGGRDVALAQVALDGGAVPRISGRRSRRRQA